MHPRTFLIAGVAAALGAVAARAGLDVPPAPTPAPDMSGYATTQALQSAISAKVPAAASAAPPAANLDGALGTSPDYARADHTHAVRVQRTVLMTASDGTATWTFARPIVVATGKLPPIAYMVEDTGSPAIVQITGRTFTSNAAAGADTHTAVTLKAQRSRVLPSLFTALFDVFGGSASGVRVNVWASDPTQ